MQVWQQKRKGTHVARGQRVGGVPIGQPAVAAVAVASLSSVNFDTLILWKFGCHVDVRPLKAPLEYCFFDITFGLDGSFIGKTSQTLSGCHHAAECIYALSMLFMATRNIFWHFR